jgi:Flp pilus assembly protein TadD
LSSWKACGLAFLCAATASAQQSFNISGELVSRGSSLLDRYTVEIQTVASHLPAGHAFVNSSGTFEIHNLAPGSYTLSVLNPAGDILTQDSLTPSQLTSHISISLPEQIGKPAPISGTVAFSTLNHQVPKKAMKEIGIAQALTKSGDHTQAIEHLKKALQIDPRSSEAHTNLGAEYARTGDYPAAHSEFTITLQLGPRGAEQYCNLAVSLFAMNHVTEAESSLGKALAVDSRNPQSNYMMGRILALRPDRSDDATRYLKLAAPGMPAANLILAQIYARSGSNQSAIDVLTAYQQTASPANRIKVAQVINSLK